MWPRFRPGRPAIGDAGRPATCCEAMNQQLKLGQTASGLTTSRWSRASSASWRDELDRWRELSLSTELPGRCLLTPHGRGTTPLRRALNSRSNRARWSLMTALGASSSMRRRAVCTITLP